MKTPILLVEAYSLWEFMAAVEDAWVQGYRVNRDDIAKVPQTAGTYHYATLDLVVQDAELQDAREHPKADIKAVLIGAAKVPEAEPEAPAKKTRAKRKAKVEEELEAEDTPADPE